MKNRHAYLIIAHNEPEVLDALLHTLDVEWNDIYLHVDKRAHALRAQAEKTRLSRARIYVIPHAMSVYWGHTSQIKVELLLMKTAVAHGPYAYYHLLSGCDMPIKPAQEIYDFFDKYQGCEFLGFWNSERDARDAQRKARYYYVFNRYKKRSARTAHLLTTPLRNIILSMQKVVGVNRLRGTIRKGFQWFSITEEFCQYVLAHERDIWKVFRYTLCGDELFLHTVIWNSPFASRLYNIEDAQHGSMRAIDWERGTPYVWKKSDVSYLLDCPYLFARKFSSAELGAVQELTGCLAVRHSSSLPCPESISIVD